MMKHSNRLIFLLVTAIGLTTLISNTPKPTSKVTKLVQPVSIGSLPNTIFYSEKSEETDTLLVDEANARSTAECKYKNSQGECLYTMKVFRTNEYPKKTYMGGWKTIGGKRKATLKYLFYRRVTAHFDKKAYRIPIKYWKLKDWNNKSYENRKKYKGWDEGEWISEHLLAEELHDSRIRTYIAPGGATLTLRRSDVKIESFSTESTHKVGGSVGLGLSWEIDIPGVYITGKGIDIKATASGTFIKSENVDDLVMKGSTIYTNNCFTTCCPVYVWPALFYSKYRAKYCVAGNQWVDYLVYDLTKKKYTGIVTRRFRYTKTNDQYAWRVNEPGNRYTGIVAEFVGPNPVGLQYCTTAEQQKCKPLNSKQLAGNQCNFGGVFK